jgi:hypothetical protein
VGKEVIEIEVDQLVGQIKALGDAAGHLDVCRLLPPHRDQMGAQSLSQHRRQDHPGIEPAREGEIGLLPRQPEHCGVERFDGGVRVRGGRRDPVEDRLGAERHVAVGEMQDAAGRDPMDLRVKRLVVRQVLQLAEIAEGLPVPAPLQAAAAQDLRHLVAMEEAAVVLGVVVVRGPDG